jgi:DNA-binding response OmpR family regulator
MTENGRATVLVVDDDPAIADGHAARLEEEYEVRQAYGGEEALAALDEAVDVVLLDRRMPGISGDNVLSEIRDRGLDCRVAMLTGVSPSFDIADMKFDDYIEKPIGEGELFGTVERLLRRSRYDDRLQEYFAVASKVGTLQAEYDAKELRDREEYVRLRARLRSIRRKIDETVAKLPPADRYAVAIENEADVRDCPDV